MQQVMESEATLDVFIDEVFRMQGVQFLACLVGFECGECSCSVGVNISTWMQAKLAEESLSAYGKSVV